MSDLVALVGACFPHPAERDALWGSIGYVIPPYLRQMVFAWRAGYLRAGDPIATEFDVTTIGAGTNWQRPLRRAWILGFRQRREETAMRRRVRVTAAEIEVTH